MTQDEAIEPFMQIGYLVSNLDEAVHAWFEESGVGPWQIYRNLDMAGNHLGRDVDIVINAAFAYSGSTQVELIEVLSEGPSPYHNPDGTKFLGLHHVARLTEDLEAELTKATERGLSVVFTGTTSSTGVAYIESTTMPGTVIEYIKNPSMPAMLAEGVEFTRNWDGLNLIRRIM